MFVEAFVKCIFGLVHVASGDCACAILCLTFFMKNDVYFV